MDLGVFVMSKYVIQKVDKCGPSKGKSTYFAGYDGGLCYDFTNNKSKACQYKTKFGANRYLNKVCKECSTFMEDSSLKVVRLKNKKRR